MSATMQVIFHLRWLLRLRNLKFHALGIMRAITL